MQNKSNFVPKSLMQPHYYQKFFDLYSAVYIGKDDKNYMLQIEGNVAINRIDGIVILVQEPDCRKPITNEVFKTIKKAVKYLETYMLKNNLL